MYKKFTKLYLIIAISLLFTQNLFSIANVEIMDAKDAFKLKVSKSNDNILFNLKIDKSAYIYDDSLSLFVKKINQNDNEFVDISSLAIFPKGEAYDEFMVIFKKINFKINIQAVIKKLSSNNFVFLFKYRGCSKAGFCYAPKKQKITYKDGIIEILKDLDKSASNKNDFANAQSKTQSEQISDTFKNANLFIILLTFFGFGILLSLTPCIFPMIPIVSSIIISYSKKEGTISTKKSFLISLVYVLSMSLAYSLAGIIAGMFGANIQIYLQNPYVIAIFASLFAILAFGMFGLFSLQMPTFIQSKLQGNKANSLFGVAITGFVSTLIVGPCVAPPLAGALIYIGQSGDFILGGLALFVMGIGLGIPLLVIGLGASKYMPKPGIWMNLISQIFGIFMLAFSIYLLERIIPTYIALYLGALLFFVYGVYLLLKKESIFKKISIVFFIFSLVLLYLNISSTTSNDLKFEKIKTLNQLEEKLKITKKPIMLDVWATWCVSCKELEEITFKNKKVKEFLTNNYVLLKIDVSKNTQKDKKLLEKFKLFGPPALMFFDKNGVEIKEKRVVGYMNAKELLEHIK